MDSALRRAGAPTAPTPNLRAEHAEGRAFSLKNMGSMATLLWAPVMLLVVLGGAWVFVHQPELRRTLSGRVPVSV